MIMMMIMMMPIILTMMLLIEFVLVVIVSIISFTLCLMVCSRWLLACPVRVQGSCFATEQIQLEREAPCFRL